MKQAQLQVAQVEALPGHKKSSADSDTKTTCLEASELCDNVLSLISMQSLLCLLRSPNVRTTGSQEQLWLRDVLASYAVPGTNLVAVRQHLEDADLILGTSVAAQYAVQATASRDGEDAVTGFSGAHETANSASPDTVAADAGVKGKKATGRAETKAEARRVTLRLRDQDQNGLLHRSQRVELNPSVLGLGRGLIRKGR